MERRGDTPGRGEPGVRAPDDRALRTALLVLRAAAVLAPASWRREGLPEWEGELWELRRRGCGAVGLMRFGFSGAMHAAWRRRQEGWGMRGFAEDLRLVCRRLVRAPGFTTVTVLILALGIGANTALFSVLSQALQGASRYDAADRLVMVDMMLARNAGEPPNALPWSYPKFELARQRIESVDALSGFALRMATLTGAGDATRLTAEMVGTTYFGVLGVEPHRGRGFTADEDPPSTGAVAVLGHALWSQRFGADPRVIGRTITLDGASFEVVGVMPAGFRGLTGRADLWLPMAAFTALGTPARLRQPWAHWFRIVGRLHQGVTLDQSRAELASVGAVLTETFPDPSGGGAHGVEIVPLLEARVNPVARVAVAAVSAGGLLLLLIACANVAGLLFARASNRRTDAAVRAALGAARSRLARESVLESLLLAGVGGAAGMLVAMLAEGLVARAVGYALETSGSRGLEYLNPDALHVGGASLAVGAGLALVIGLLAGLLPVPTASRPDLSAELRGASAGGFQRRRAGGETARALLVSVQLAFTLVLLAGTGLIASSLMKLSRVEVGFANDDVLALRFDAGPGRAAEDALAFEREVVERVGALPGVLEVATAPCPPLSGVCEVTGVRQTDDDPPVDYGEMESILTYEVSAKYFSALGIDVLEGRVFDGSLAPEDPPLVMVSKSAADKHFGGSAVGHRLAVTHALTEERQAEIIGVVEDVRYGSLEEEVLPAVYFYRPQATPAYGSILVHTAGDPGALLEAVRTVVRGIDPSLALSDVTTVAELQAVATARTRVLLWLLLAFSAVGLLLCAVGVYGVVSYDVQRRTRETGLRLALGAPVGDVLRATLTRPALFACIGSGVGVVGALLLTRQLRALLFQVEAADPRVMTAATVVLLAVTMTAAWVPTRKALRVDPAQTLRGE